ncbi:MAG: sensor histidine kinase [Treponema sp.]|nr:sensor histidine kinase [Treponema sp.]
MPAEHHTESKSALRLDGEEDSGRGRRNGFRFRLWMAALVVAAHALALAVFFSDPPRPPGSSDWPLQFSILVALSLVCSLVSQRFDRKVVPAILLGLQLFLLAAADYPDGAEQKLTFIFLCILVVTLLSLLRLPYYLIAAADALFVLAFRFRPVRVWNGLPAAPGMEDSLLLLLSLALVSAVLARVFRLYEAFEAQARDLEAMDNSISNLLNANVDFQNHAVQVGERSTIEERKRLSREIHDIVGYTLINLKMMLESAIDLAGSSNRQLAELLARARDQAQSSLGETRMALQAFRDMEKSNLDAVSSIHRIITLFSRATGIEVEVNYGNMPWGIDEELGGTLRRIVQESMTNSFRHGRATRIQIGFWIAHERLLVKVDDNGQGAAEIRPGIGLLGMRERVEGLGGKLEIDSAGYGFSIRAEIPLGAEDVQALPPPVTDLAAKG